LTIAHNSAIVVLTMPDEQSAFLQNDDQLLEIALSIDPQILAHFRLLEQPYRGGPDFRYLYTTAQIQEVIIQSVQLTVSRTAPFTLTGPYGTGKSTIITRTFSLLHSKEQFDVRLITLHRGVTRNWLIRKIAEAFNVKTARSYSQTLENVQIYFARVDQTKVGQPSSLMTGTLWMMSASHPSIVSSTQKTTKLSTCSSLSLAKRRCLRRLRQWES
jgi:type II secretory pathway predicted ATPase ExeA